MKHYSIGLLVAGIGLIAASCAPLAQIIRSNADSPPVRRLALPPAGESGVALDVAERITSIPIILIEPYPGAIDAAPATLSYSFSITDESGRALLREDGNAVFDPGAEQSGPLRAGILELRFREVTIPSGRWLVRLDTRFAAGPIRGAELRLVPPSPGLMPALLTTLALAILGWLAAALGGLQWIRAEAVKPSRALHGRETAGADRERLWTVGCHLSALLGYILPFGHVLGPLAIWWAKRHSLPAVEQAGRSALNFQLSITLYVLAGLLLSFFLIGLVVLFLVAVLQFSIVLYASLRAQRGLDVHYPFSIRFI